MRISKRLDGRQWQKTLAVTGLVTGSLVLGTLGNVSAHADDAPSQRTTDATTKAVNGPTVDQTTRQVTLKSGTPAPVTSDESKTSMPANNDKKTVTPVVSPKTPVNKPDQPAVPESTQVVKQPVTAVHTPVTPAVPANATPTPENEQPVQPAQMPAVAPTTTTKTPATTQAIDEWMPDKNLQQIVLKALQLSQKKGETPYTDVSQITQDNVAQLTKINPNYGRWINGDIVRGDTLYKAILNVTDLTGLEKATNLEELNLSTDDPNVDPDAQAEGKTWTRGALKDLSKLSGLENLSHLDIAETSVSDLTPILNLPKLTSLVAHDALIQTLQPNGVTTSSVLDNLTYLDLDRNQLTSLAGLENNTQLSSLMAQDNKIKSVQPLANISVPMSILYLGGNQIYDLSPLSKIDFQNGYLDVWKQTAFLNKPITVDTAKDSYDFESPVLDNVATEQALKAYLGGEIAKTSLKATPTDAFANKITLNGIVKYGKKYIIFSWDNGNNFEGFLYVPYKLKTDKPAGGNTGTVTTPVTKPTETQTPVTQAPVTATEVTPVTTSTPVTPIDAKTPLANVAAFKPFMIYTKDALNRYTQATFKENKIKKSYRKYTRQTAPTFKVVGVKKSVNGHLRYLLSNGTYVTARKDFVANLYWQGKHYTKIRVDRTIYEHQTTKFTKKNRVRVFKQGKVVTVKRIIHRGYMTRYQLTNGHWITGNKQFITPIKKA